MLLLGKPGVDHVPDILGLSASSRIAALGTRWVEVVTMLVTAGTILVNLLLLLLLLWGDHGVDTTKAGPLILVPGEDPAGGVPQVVRADIGVPGEWQPALETLEPAVLLLTGVVACSIAGTVGPRVVIPEVLKSYALAH